MSQSICDQIFCLSSDNQIWMSGIHLIKNQESMHLFNIVCHRNWILKSVKQCVASNVLQVLEILTFRSPNMIPYSHRSCKGQRSAPRRCSTTRTIKLQDQGFFCFAVGVHRIATNLTSISQIFRFTVIESLLSSGNNGVYSRNEIVALISADHLLEFRPQGFKW